MCGPKKGKSLIDTILQIEKESLVYLPTLRKITLSIRHVLSYSKGVLLLIMTLGSIQTPHTEKTIYFLWLTCFL